MKKLISKACGFAVIAIAVMMGFSISVRAADQKPNILESTYCPCPCNCASIAFASGSLGVSCTNCLA